MFVHHFVDQAGLELGNPPASASQVLGLKACATTPSKHSFSNSQPQGTKGEKYERVGKEMALPTSPEKVKKKKAIGLGRWLSGGHESIRGKSSDSQHGDES